MLGTTLKRYQRISFVLLIAAYGNTGAQTDSIAGGDHFARSAECIACHSNLTAPSGADVSIGYSWRASMMANSARDPYWHSAVRRESMDHPQAQPAIEDKCSTCHMPMARFIAVQTGGRGQVFAKIGDPLSMDGVSCTVCHQIRADNFGEHASFDGGFLIQTQTQPGIRMLFGPHDVSAGHSQIMQSAVRFVPEQSDHLKKSELCATCHTLYTQALGENGEIVGELAEQVPYPEWRHSAYRSTRSCQDCHMPELEKDTAITSVLGVPRPGFSQHAFRGANAFMLNILNKYRDELGVTATPQELSAAAQRAIDYLASSSARLSIEEVSLAEGKLDFAVDVRSLAGHKLPTAYPSRRVWLHVTIRDTGGNTVFESGALRPDGSIVGNDNDDDGTQYESHYHEITRPDQVQIYEPVLADRNGRLTTGLLSGVRYIKDNRILPIGFDKATAAPDIAVYGAAREDPDFVAGGDRIRYRIDLASVPGALDIIVELNYQTVGFRWAQNLRSYEAGEPRRFVSYYEETAAYSGITIATATAGAPN